jgi:Fic family protein
MPGTRPLFETEDRSYTRTHPWINFTLSLDRARPELWVLLGEACSKCDHIADTPLLPEVADQLHQLFLAKGARATTAIEGSTLSEEDVQRRVRGELSLPPSQEYMGQAIDNIVEAIRAIPDRMTERQSGRVAVQDILYYNRLVLKGRPEASQVKPGAVRTYDVTVGRYTGPNPQDCYHLLERLCSFIDPDHRWVPDASPMIDAILKAIIAHLYIAWIHPFGDGNGRTARLVEYHILVGGGVPSPAAHLLSNHYNETRDRYYAFLDAATSSQQGVLGFLEYALQGFVDGLRSQLQWIRAQLSYLTWSDLVYSSFRDSTRDTEKRRRDLALALINLASPLTPRAVRDLSPRLAELYARRQDRAIKRDLDTLVNMNLALRVEGGYRANVQRIWAALPGRLDFGPGPT